MLFFQSFLCAINTFIHSFVLLPPCTQTQSVYSKVSVSQLSPRFPGGLALNTIRKKNKKQKLPLATKDLFTTEWVLKRRAKAVSAE